MSTLASTSDVTLLFVELQPALLAGDKTVSAGDISKATHTCLEIAEKLDIPVICSTVQLGPGGPTDMIEPLASYTSFVRKTPGMFEDAAISQAVMLTGRKTVAIGGVSSEIAILHSVLGAIRQGYTVYVLTDCCSGLSKRTEEAAFRQMEKAGATMSNLSSFFSMLVPEMNDFIGSVVFSSLSKHWGWS